MDLRPAFGALLVISACSLHAQPSTSIGGVLDKCLGGTPGNQAARKCIGSEWAGSLQSRDQQCDKARANERASFSQELGSLKKACDAQATAAEARIAAARVEERERIRARRAGGISAVKLFVYEFDANSKNLDRELELTTDPGLAGTVIVRRKNSEVAVLLPFPSLASEDLRRDKENRLYLSLQCRTDSGNCITTLGKDGSVKVMPAVNFAISEGQADVLLKAARDARQAFTD